MFRICSLSRQLEAPPLSVVLRSFLEYLENISSPKYLLLIGHNAHTFDAPRLVKAIANDPTLASQFKDKMIIFGDSLWALKQVLKRKRNIKLSDVYQEVSSSCATLNYADCKKYLSVRMYVGDQWNV